MEQALASGLGLSPSHVHITSVQPGSVVEEVLAVADDAKSLATLDAALGRMVADPMAVFGSALASKYGISGSTLTLHLPPFPPGPPQPPQPPMPPPSAPPPQPVDLGAQQGQDTAGEWGSSRQVCSATTEGAGVG